MINTHTVLCKAMAFLSEGWGIHNAYQYGTVVADISESAASGRRGVDGIDVFRA
jgi:hypothetical protein